MFSLTRDQQMAAAKLGVQFGTLLFNRGITALEAADRAGVAVETVKDLMAGDAGELTVSTIRNMAMSIGGTVMLEIKADDVPLGALMQAIEGVGGQIRPSLQMSSAAPVPTSGPFVQSRPAAAPVAPVAPIAPVETPVAAVNAPAEAEPQKSLEPAEAKKPTAMDILARAVVSSGFSPV